MAIIVQRKGERAEIVSEIRFPDEAELQRYVYENPQVLPIPDIKEDVQFTVLDKETPVRTGYIDILGVDSEGDLYIIETKLFTNSDKRKVLAQVLDYGAAMWSAHQAPEAFLRLLDERLSQKGTSLRELLEWSFGQAAEEVEEGMRRCLESGAFRFIILMNRVPSDLKTLIQFVNSYSNFSVYAVELGHYKHGDLHIFVPHVFGAEERKRVPSSGSKRWNEASFFQVLVEKVDPNTAAAMHKLYDFTKSYADEIVWGRGGKGAFNAKFFIVSPKSLYTAWDDGKITFRFGWLVGEAAEKLRGKLGGELRAIDRLAPYVPTDEHRFANIPPEAWVPVYDELLAALDRFLAYAKEVSAERGDGPTPHNLGGKSGIVEL